MSFCYEYLLHYDAHSLTSVGRPWVPLVWASSVWSAAKPSRRERLVRGARERLLAWRDAFGRMQCGLSAASPRAALIGSWAGGGEGVQEGKIHAHGAPPDNLTCDALPTLCATAARWFASRCMMHLDAGGSSGI